MINDEHYAAADGPVELESPPSPLPPAAAGTVIFLPVLTEPNPPGHPAPQ